MHNKIAALTAELELVKAANNVKYEQLMSKVNTLINEIFIINNARLLRSWASKDFYPDEVIFRFEIGFHNHEKNKIDWGSEIDFTFNSRTGLLSINHGCVGTFNKTDVEQFQRAKLISYVFDNIDEIEKKFATLSEFANNALGTSDEMKLEVEIIQLKEKLKQQEFSEIESTLVKDVRLEYSAESTVPSRYRLFTECIEITRCSPKTVFVKDKWDREVRIKKEDLINHIYRGDIVYA